MCEFMLCFGLFPFHLYPKTRWRKRSSSGPGCEGSESSPVALMWEGVGRKYVYGRVCLCVSAQIYTDRNAQIDLWEWYTTTDKWKRMQDGWRPVLLTLSFPVCTSLTSGGGRGSDLPTVWAETSPWSSNNSRWKNSFPKNSTSRQKDEPLKLRWLPPPLYHHHQRCWS